MLLGNFVITIVSVLYKIDYINKLDVEMDNSKILLDGKPMKFTLDEKNVIELLQGNNLYHGIEDVVRELIQNAIDATLLKVWIDFRNNDVKRDILESGNPYDSEVHKILKDYPINISLTLVQTTADYENIWRLCIEDHGTGISLEDLKYMQYMGGSDKNLKKQKITRGMPRWMQPSGAFGIGMHSVFLLSKDNPDKYQHLCFSTKSIFSHEPIEIKLHSPLSRDNGYCFISYLDDNNEYIPYGTTTEIFLKTDLDFSSKMSKSDAVKARYFLSILANSMSHTFSKNTPEIIFKDIDLKQDIQNSLHEIIDNYKPDKNIAWFYYEKYSFAIQLYMPDTLCNIDFDYETVYSFRGQEIPIYRNSMDFIHTFRNARIYIDIYGNAKDFLNISRNDWKSYDLVYDVIDNVKHIFKNKNMDQINKKNIIYGFDYNKNLGLNILGKEINSIELQDSDIAQLKLDKKVGLNEIINEKLLILGEKNLTKKIVESFERDKIFSNIKSFNVVNDIYYDAAITYFMNNGFSVYKVVFSGSLDSYDSRKILFLYKTESFSSINFSTALYIDDFNVAIFTLISKDLLKNESYESNFISKYKFLDEIKRCENTLEDNTIYIKSSYNDYHLFYDFKNLEINIPEHCSLYTFYSETGIIFPFYFENNNIIMHDLEQLYKFVKSKSVDSQLTFFDIKSKYKKLIDLIYSLTKDDSKWNDFFNNNDF